MTRTNFKGSQLMKSAEQKLCLVTKTFFLSNDVDVLSVIRKIKTVST